MLLGRVALWFCVVVEGGKADLGMLCVHCIGRWRGQKWIRHLVVW